MMWSRRKPNWGTTSRVGNAERRKLPSPSPCPSPWGRGESRAAGRVVWKYLRQVQRGISHENRRRFSLSPRERAGVRGKGLNELQAARKRMGPDRKVQRFEAT